MQQAVIAVDTESNSLYAYREQVCLLQFTADHTDYIVDPLVIDDLSPLGPAFASPNVETIFHAADYDLIVLERDFGFTFGKIFDTMWAARILGWPRVGLGDILETYFDVGMNKRYQRYNWGRRPLEPEAVSYARMDTHYLPELRKIQMEELKAKGRWQEAQEVFDYLRSTVTQPPEPTLEYTFWRIKGMHKLSSAEKRVLYNLHKWREETAKKMDRPTMKVLSNKRLVTLARTQPRSKKGLASSGLSSYQIRRFGKGILRALRAKPTSYPPQPHDHERPSHEVMERYNALRAWRKSIAARRGVDSDVILPNATLWEIAHEPPKRLDDLLEVPGIGPWRREAYGPDILRLLS
jgi:ribonuclease D